MSILLRYKYHIAAVTILMAFIFASTKTKTNEITDDAKDLPRIETNGQIEHAIELLPAKQTGRVLAMEEKIDVRQFIYKKVQESLPAAYRHRAYEVSRSIIVEANHHGMDPMFLMAVITTESQFNPKARGSHGEIGLMQILPSTAAWIAPQAGIASNKIDLEDPSTNIRIGATYFAQLRKRFNKHGTRYVSAYNMGVANVRRLVAKQVEPKEYSTKVLGNYANFYAALETKPISAGTAARSIASVK
jgi:soluble lytic murein transglycosylase